MKTKYFIGIDPGKTGGIAAINKETGQLILHEIPLIGKELDVVGLVEIINGYTSEPHFFCLENVHALPGASAGSSFSFGRTLGAKEAILVALKATFQKIAPKKWQSVVWEGIPNMKKPNGKNDTKAMSLLAAQRLFPNQKFLKSKDGLIDAALMAKYLELSYGI
jgi:hypothetical protein